MDVNDGKSAPSPSPIAFFAHERTDARVAKRIAALQDNGREVVGFTFHRVRDKEDVPPGWENIHLGVTYNRRYLQRLWAIIRSVGVLWRHRRRLAECGTLYAVNTDNAVLALLGSMLAGRKLPLVLELADIQPLMLGKGAIARVLRMSERIVLRRSKLLVTTSPGFIKHYFEPQQHYLGPVFLMENKIYPSHGLPQPVVRDAPVAAGDPWVVGYFGALRCERSIKRMRMLAERLGGRIRFILRGYPAATFGGDFKALLGDLPNLDFGGPYEYPGDLAEMYADIDFNWAFDESSPGGNSAWLLPNRIYEGGFFNAPAIAAKGTETGCWIERHNLGWTFDNPLDENLARFFETLTVEKWREMRRHCEVHPREDFEGERDYAKLAGKL